MPIAAIYMLSGGVLLGGGTYALKEGTNTALKLAFLVGVGYLVMKKVSK